METNTTFFTILLFTLFSHFFISTTCANPISTISTSSTKLINGNNIATKIINVNNIAPVTVTNAATQASITYIKTACNSTRYIALCYNTLSPHASIIQSDPKKLCNVSLTLALKAARVASSNIAKAQNSNNLTNKLKDCGETVDDAVEKLQESLVALGSLSGATSKAFQISNIKTWLSASLTNDETCVDELNELNVDVTIKNKIKKTVLKAKRMNSNALAFVNRFA